MEFLHVCQVPKRRPNLPAGMPAPHTGVYVVSHYHPPHAVTREVAIVAAMILPHCNICADVRFSLEALAAEPIRDSEFFRDRDDD
jgi:hypothetical protein